MVNLCYVYFSNLCIVVNKTMLCNIVRCRANTDSSVWSVYVVDHVCVHVMFKISHSI